MNPEAPPAEKEGASHRSSLRDSLVTSPGSAKTAVELLIIMAFFSALGTLIPQNQEREFYGAHYGDLPGRLMLAASLDNIYYSWWFILLLVLVAINLVISNARRLDILLKNAQKNRVIMVGRDFFQKSPTSLKLSAPGESTQISVSLERSLHHSGYRTAKEDTGEEIYLHAQKGGLRRWGSLVTHTGILIVFLGVIYGHWPGMGFKGMALMATVDEYSLFQVKEAGFSLKMLATGSKSDERGRPLDYYSRVEVLEERRKVLEKIIRVNDPLEYRGVKFYQSTFGVMGFYLNVTGPDDVLYEIPVNLTPEGAPDMELPAHVPGTDLFVFIHKLFHSPGSHEGTGMNQSANHTDAAAEVFVYEDFKMNSYNKWKARGRVSLDAPLKYGGYEIKMGDLINYSGLQYRKDPGVPIVWAGFLFTTLGLVISFYLPEKTMRILVCAGIQENNLIIQTYSRNEEDFDQDISQLQKAIKES